MRSRTDYRNLINQGRKAGLKTSEMYDALAARRLEAGDRIPDPADGNGYVSELGLNGQRVYCPYQHRTRS